MQTMQQSAGWHKEAVAILRSHRVHAVAFLVGLSGCGGGGDVAPSAAPGLATERANHIVTAAELPSLQQCLTDLNQAVIDNPTQRHNIDLECAAGTYYGRSDQGEACTLRVDASLGHFGFDHGSRHVEIDWQDVAYRIDGQRLHNLAPSQLDSDNPGLQLTRFSPLPVPTTETLALRDGVPVSGKLGVLQLSYLRVKAEQVTQVDCRFVIE